MASCPRAEIVHQGEVEVFHVWTRCVRRAFLCGNDPHTGRDYEYRRQWIHGFQQQLAGLFGVEIGFHAELSNHLHLVLRARPDVVATWSDEEVARRQLTIDRLVKSKDGCTISQVSEAEITLETADADRIAELRKRLSSISFFMKALCEHIGRRANREDGCTGRFFEGRFGCRWLADEAAIFVCGIYVDLNQIRAGEADTPEESTHTSAFDRIGARNAGDAGSDSANQTTQSADGWMCELTLQEGLDVDVRLFNRTQSTRRASDKGLLPLSLDEYLAMLHWTARQGRGNSTGCIPSHLSSLLERLGINGQFWTELATKFDRCFGHVVGRASDVAMRASQAGRRFYRGQARCAEAFG